MKAKLVLSLTSAHLRVDVLRLTSGRGILPSLLRIGKARWHAEPEFSAIISQGGLRARLDQAMAELKVNYGAALPGFDLEVQLGQAHAHIGVMVLEELAATDLSFEKCESYVQAWVRQMLHLEPHTHLIRWQILPDAHKLLVSCVDRLAFDELQDFSLRNGLRFVSCRPAILSATPEDDMTVVWTESGADASRSSSVQLLRFQGKQISSAWRGWIPRSSGSEGADGALEGAVRRFQARHSAHGDPVNHIHWPR